MARVYVSSTIADLDRERRAVMEWLVDAGHQPVHSYLPDSDTVRDSCLADVDTCDLYVLILGHRYGFQPEQDNPECLSITHLEFRRAGQSGIPRIALLSTSILDVSRSDVADPRRLALVSAFRNEVISQVRPAEFSDPLSLIRGLSTGVPAELARLGDRMPAGRTGGPVLQLAPRPAFLAGREELLADLGARLAGRDGADPRVVVLHGLGGAGKTSVALEYAHRHLAEMGLAWQFGAEDTTALEAGFGELADELGTGASGNPVAAVHGMLAAYRAPWLLVFDNAPSRDSVAPFVPPAGRGRVLITSRHQIWPPDQGLAVPVLDPEVAADFLVGRTGDTDRQAALDLAGELGGLPLALEQAAAYVQASGGSLAGYLASFRRRRADLLRRGEPTGYSQTVATAWTLAFEDLQHATPGAAGLLRLLAFCAPEAIPLRLLLRPREGLAEQLSDEITPVLTPLLEDELAAGDAVAALRRYSLLTPIGGGSVSVHRLVQAVTADQMAAELARKWRQAAAGLIEAAIPSDARLRGTWEACAMLLPHAQAALNPTSGGIWQIARYLGHSGSYAAARDLFGLIADAYMADDAYGAEHPRTLRARHYFAHWTGDAGDAAAARDQYAALLPAHEQKPGREHPDTLTTRGNLARWTGEAGNAAAARDQYATLLPVQERVVGPEHADTLTTRAELAAWTGEAGDAAAARDQFAALLPVFERVVGPEHPNTLDTRASLAKWTGEAGNAAAARDQYAALLPVRERVQGPEHPNTLMARASLATWTGDAGDAAAARDQYAALLPVQQRVMGPEHPSPLASRAEFARWTGEAGNAAAARDQFAALVLVRERVQGPEHPRTLIARTSLADWTGETGGPAAARDQLATLVPIMDRVLGPEHPETLSTRQDLAYWTAQAGDWAAARDQFAALLSIQQRVLGPEHPRTLAARSGLAVWTGQAGDPAGARDQLAALLPNRERVLGAEHPDTLTDRANLAYWTGSAGDAAGARDQLAALLPVMERALGAEHPETLVARGNLAVWTGSAGDPAGARDQLAALLPIRERVSGAEHPDSLTDRTRLAYWTDEADGGVSRGLK